MILVDALTGFMQPSFPLFLVLQYVRSEGENSVCLPAGGHDPLVEIVHGVVQMVFLELQSVLQVFHLGHRLFSRAI